MQFTTTRLKKDIYNKNISTIHIYFYFFYLKQNKIKQDFKKERKKNPPTTNERKCLRLKIGHPSANYG